METEVLVNNSNNEGEAVAVENAESGKVTGEGCKPISDKECTTPQDEDEGEGENQDVEMTNDNLNDNGASQDPEITDVQTTADLMETAPSNEVNTNGNEDVIEMTESSTNDPSSQDSEVKEPMQPSLEEPTTENKDLSSVTSPKSEDPIKERLIEHIEEIQVEINKDAVTDECFVCQSKKPLKYMFTIKPEDKIERVCSDECLEKLKVHCTDVKMASYFDKKLRMPLDEEVAKFVRKCKQCTQQIKGSKGICSWEAMDFCKEHCLYRYQVKYAKICSECKKVVEFAQCGKYSVRFGSILRQFCSSACLDARKKKIRICSYCQLAMTGVGIAFGLKFFCTLKCKDKFVCLTMPHKPPYVANPETTFCFICADRSKPLTKEFAYENTSYYFCGEECCTIFTKLHNITDKVGKCHNCCKSALLNHLEAFGLHYDGTFHHFCSTICQHIHIITNRRIVGCVWCRVKKYNFDMIYKEGLMDDVVHTCSLSCLNQLKAAVIHLTRKGKNCEQCKNKAAVCDISTGDGTSKSFCSNSCIAEFQSKRRKREMRMDKAGQLPVITSINSLADSSQQTDRQVILIEEEPLPEMANKIVTARPLTMDADTQTIRLKTDCEVQTNMKDEMKACALPVPIYIPQPLDVWQCPLPRAIPFPLVVPVPILIPLTRDASTDYLKSMKREPVKPTTTDPFEAELLMMAELVATEKTKEEAEEPESEADDDYGAEPGADGEFHDDVLQMAWKMATDYQASAVDLEGALQANTITPGPGQTMELTNTEDIIHSEPLNNAIRGGPGRARGRGRGRGSRGGSSGRRGRGRPPATQHIPITEPTPPQPTEPVIKPDANMCLKFTFGVNAWKQWVTTKNADMERSSRKLKLFKTDILQMTADELNYSLCLFVNEVRKPNGTEYAPDTIYYLCLGIQQYLYENGRIDNIFCDAFYHKFTDCLDEVCGKFSSLYSDSHYIVTRVEEEHLWESKQLGAHSPYVLLTTLMFFNTKHFNLTTVDEHMQLSFSHIMKHWKRNPGPGGSSGTSRQPPAGSRNVLLRFYPPQNINANVRKKKVYEQQENEDNPLRCPVKLYEFYLSKCPESVKTRNDVFYLMPERSCVPESPVWYSTMALETRALRKMLHRVKMVKEINVALLTH